MQSDSDLEQAEGGAEEAGELQGAKSSGAIHMHQPALLQAHRALLEKTFISSSDQEYFWIKTQYQALKTWHRLHTGWRLEWRNNLFCLMRQPGALTPGHGDSKSLLQTARDFVYVVWILWYAANDQITKRGNGQLFLLAQMLERLAEEWASRDCFDWLKLEEVESNHLSQPLLLSNRKSMARALKYLQELKCLEELDGQADAWVEQNSRVLYQFTNATHLLIMSLDIGAYKAIIECQKGATIFTPGVLSLRGGKMDALLRAWRALLIGPFLLRFDDEEAFAALVERSEEVRDELDAAFGWYLEVNHDYACIIRDRDAFSALSGNLLNLKNARDQIVLLFCSAIRGQVAAGALKPDYYGCIATTFPNLLDLFARMREQFEEYWGKGMRDKKNKELFNEVLKKMRQSGLIRGPAENAVLVLPTAARYQAHYAEFVADMPASRQRREGRGAEEDVQQAALWSSDEEE
jgi:Protein of unknown function (DUF2398)